MKIDVGDIYIRGDLIKLQKFFIRIDAVKRSKVKIAHFMKARQQWVTLPDWISASKLELIPATPEDLLEL